MTRVQPENTQLRELEGVSVRVPAMQTACFLPILKLQQRLLVRVLRVRRQIELDGCQLVAKKLQHFFFNEPRNVFVYTQQENRLFNNDVCVGRQILPSLSILPEYIPEYIEMKVLLLDCRENRARRYLLKIKGDVRKKQADIRWCTSRAELCDESHRGSLGRQ